MVRTPGSYCISGCIYEEAQAGSHMRHLRTPTRLFAAMILFVAKCHGSHGIASPASAAKLGAPRSPCLCCIRRSLVTEPCTKPLLAEPSHEDLPSMW